MAKYGQLSPAEFFRADMLGLGRDYALVLAWITQAELEDVPAKEFRKSLEKLRKNGFTFTLEIVFGKTLSERIRKNRYRNKSGDLAKLEDVPRDVPRDVPGDVPRNVPGDVAQDVPRDVASRSSSLSSSSSKKIKEKPAKPSAPRYILSKRACLEQWNQAVTAVTGEPSCQSSMALETKAQAFHKIVTAAGETFEDVVRRRVKLRRKLILTFVMGDYADDRRQAAEEKPEEVFSPAALRAPAGAVRYAQLRAEGKVP